MDAFEQVMQLRDAFLEAVAQRLEGSTVHDPQMLARRDIPPAAGVYGFYSRNGGEPYFGESLSLRRRIWANHLNGSVRRSAFRKRVARALDVSDEDAITQAIEQGYELRWLPLSLGRKEAEEYLKRVQGIPPAEDADEQP